MLQKAAFIVWAVLCLLLTLHALASTTLEQYETFHIYYQPLICLVAMLWLVDGQRAVLRVAQPALRPVL